MIHIHTTACLSRVCEEPSVLILKNAVDMYDSNVSSQIHMRNFAVYMLVTKGRAGRAEVIVSERILCPTGQITRLLQHCHAIRFIFFFFFFFLPIYVM